MNEHIEKKVMRNTYHIIKIDQHSWDKIAGVIKEYDNLNIEVEAHSSKEQFDDMSSAYDAVCQYTDDIKTITISASKGNEDMEIIYTNNELPETYLQEVKYSCDSSKTRELYRFFDALRDDSQVHKKGIGPIVSTLLGLFFLLSQLGRFLGMYSFIVTLLMFFVFVFGITLFFDSRLTSKIVGDKHIQFWTSKAKIEEYQVQNTKKQKLAKNMYIVSVALFALALAALAVSFILSI